MLSSKILPGILAVVPATILLTAEAGWSEPAAEACRTSPGSSAPAGSHWYYRINRPDKRHCWYLGARGLGSRTHGVIAAATATTATAQKAKAIDTAFAAAPTPNAAASVPAAASATMPAQTAPVLLTPAPVVFSEQSVPVPDKRMDFVARWPDDLPNARDLDQPEPAAMSNSYADAHAAADAPAQTSLPWPVVAAVSARQFSTGEMALRFFSFAGASAIAVLLLLGWAAKFTRRQRHAPIRNPWRARWPSPRRGADFAEMAANNEAAAMRYGDPMPRPSTLTDPAHDLKTSLAELMRDLRRADAAWAPSPSFAQLASLSRHSAYGQDLQEELEPELQLAPQ